MPQFSIIIPVYNASATLAETLASVAKQSFTDFEVILVDDGSTDDSAQIITTETKEWPNVRVIAQENKGLGNARNVAAKIATGHWLVFLDADDYWAAEKLAVLSQAILRHPETELFYHPIFEKYPNGNMRKRAFWEVNSMNDFIEKGNPFVPSAMAIKRDAFLEAGGFIEDRNQVEDLLLWLKLLAGGINVQAINRPLTVYQMGVGVTGNLMEHLEKVKKALISARKGGYISGEQEATFVQRKNYEAARQLHKLGEFEIAIEYYTKVEKQSAKKRVLVNLCLFKIRF
jgi:glycosyltransferase involved in cell wall biosynthesis